MFKHVQTSIKTILILVAKVLSVDVRTTLKMLSIDMWVISKMLSIDVRVTLKMLSIDVWVILKMLSIDV